MTLIATVLLSVLAATITIIVVRQALVLSSSETGRANTEAVSSKAGDIQAQFEAQLAQNPQFYLTSLFAYERPRQCLAPSAAISGKFVENTVSMDGTSVRMSASAWPSDCGTTWAYPPVPTDGQEASVPAASLVTASFNAQTGAVSTAAASSAWKASSMPTRAEVLPPTPSDPALTLRVLSNVGPSEVGLEARYQRNSASQWTLWSSRTLDLSQTVTSDALGAGSTVYSSQRVVLPSGASTLQVSAVAGEAGVDGFPLAGGTRLLSGDAAQVSGGAGRFSPIRSSVPQPLTLDALRSSLTQTDRVGCPGISGAPGNIFQAGQSRTNFLCLQAGAQVTNAAGQALTLPTGPVQAWLLKLTTFTATVNGASVSYPAVAVYYSPRQLAYVSDCLVACDLDLAATGLSSTLMGSSHSDPTVPPEATGLTPWLPVAADAASSVFLYPAGGVLSTDATTFVSTQSDASTATASLTIVAGSLSDPADLVIGGDIYTQPSALLGLVATRSLLVPYFATAVGGTTEVTAALAALGLGTDRAATSGVPTTAVPAAGPSRSLVVTGSLASDGLGTIQSASSVSLVPDSRLRTSQPPLFPAFTPAWHQATATTIGPSDVCAAALSSTVATCARAW